MIAEADELHLSHDASNPTFGLFPSSQRSPGGFQIAPEGCGSFDSEPAGKLMPAWVAPRAEPRSQRVGGEVITIPSPAAGSCMLTGAHLMKLPTVYPGRPKEKLIEGACANCGLIKRFPTRGRRKRANSGVQASGSVLRSEQASVGAGSGKDELAHWPRLPQPPRQGSISALERSQLMSMGRRSSLTRSPGGWRNWGTSSSSGTRTRSGR